MFGAKYGQQGFSIFSIFLLFSFSGCIGGGGGGGGGQVQLEKLSATSKLLKKGMKKNRR